MLLSQQGGISWATHRGIRNQKPLANYAFPYGDTNASTELCYSQIRTTSNNQSGIVSKQTRAGHRIDKVGKGIKMGGVLITCLWRL
ncbi:hypothetical protein RHMOL_Rhmol07G0241400 [Rhododendron molle]|uniref:Uncharacterized protein n=1 Tax=Rhododendron molle TaxID=49168 RepID=A0ACC0N5D0_RHOML|nr:hypothetical protein RHMOL_Rhmol07G0241400 [Rhododendron molle]